VPDIKQKKVRFKPYDQEQTFLFPPSLDDYVGKLHIARLISRIIDTINITHIIATYKGGGASSYEPRMLLKLWILGYVYRIYTSRRLAKMTRENTAFIWISGNQQPDFRTLNNFRKRLNDDIKLVFKEIVKLGLKIGMIKGEDIFIDHTKMEADANKHKMVWKKQVKRQLGRIEDELDVLFKYIEELNSKEDREFEDKDFDEMERDNFDDEMVQGLIEEINVQVKKKEMDREKAREARKNIRRAHELLKRQKDYERKQETLGDRNSYSKTDGDAVAMRMKDGITTRPGYNEGIAVENGFIVGYDIHDSAADNVGFINLMENAIDNLNKIPDNVCADSAYGNEENYDYLENRGIGNYVKYNTYHKEKSKKWNEEKFRQNAFEYNKERDSFTCPNGLELVFEKIWEKITKTGFKQTIRAYLADELECSTCPYKGKCTRGKRRGLYINENLIRLKASARENLNSEEGIKIKKRRGHEAETPFGDKKWNHKFKRYHLRGIEKVTIEAGLFYSMYNMKKIYVYILDHMREMMFDKNYFPAIELKQ